MHDLSEQLKNRDQAACQELCDGPSGDGAQLAIHSAGSPKTDGSDTWIRPWDGTSFANVNLVTCNSYTTFENSCYLRHMADPDTFDAADCAERSGGRFTFYQILPASGPSPPPPSPSPPPPSPSPPAPRPPLVQCDYYSHSTTNDPNEAYGPLYQGTSVSTSALIGDLQYAKDACTEHSECDAFSTQQLDASLSNYRKIWLKKVRGDAGDAEGLETWLSGNTWERNINWNFYYANELCSKVSPPPSPTPSPPPLSVSSMITCDLPPRPVTETSMWEYMAWTGEVGWSLSCSDGTTLSGFAPYPNPNGYTGGSLRAQTDSSAEQPLAVALGATCTLNMTDRWHVGGWNGVEWSAPGFGQTFSLAEGMQGSESFVVGFQPPPPSPPSPTLPCYMGEYGRRNLAHYVEPCDDGGGGTGGYSRRLAAAVQTRKKSERVFNKKG